MVIFTIILIILYFLTHVFLRYGLNKSMSLSIVNPSPSNKVTVIVAARNEEKIIARCISALKKLTYNKDKLEIFLVNDKSTDLTKEIMLKETQGLSQFKIIDSRPQSSTNLKGKANALDTAISLASGEIIIGTDADCKVSEDWIQEVLKYYDAKTAMVCGVTCINFSESVFYKLQAIDWVYLQTLASSSSGINMTLSCIGNNLSFRKSVYEELGGYGNIKFSVTEDLALMQEIHSKGYLIKYPVNQKSLVETEACKSLDELFKQKRRWFRGGLKINMLGLLLGLEMYPVNLILLFGWLFLSWEIYFLFILVKIISEIILIYKPVQEYKLNSLYSYYFHFQLFFAFYGLTLPWTFLFNTKIKWKDRKF